MTDPLKIFFHKIFFVQEAVTNLFFFTTMLLIKVKKGMWRVTIFYYLCTFYKLYS